MLGALVELGKQLAQQAGEFDPIIKNVKTDTKKRNYNLKILIDLDNTTLETKLQEYSEKDASKFIFFSLSGNHKKIYTVHNDHKKIYDSLFGEGEPQFIEFVDDKYENYKQTVFYEVLKKVSKSKTLDKLFKEQIEKEIEKAKENKESLALFVVYIKYEEIGISEMTPMPELEGYKDFLREKFSLGASESDETGFCYALNSSEANVEGASFKDRYSINKIFVDTTKNYISNFNSKNLNNYNISSKANRYLTLASKHLLDNMNIYIAKVPHVIIPQFLSATDFNYGDIEFKIKKGSEFIFNPQEIEELSEEISFGLEEGSTFWLSYCAYESDGNYLKIVNIIKDIPEFYFIKILETINENHNKLREISIYKRSNIINLNQFYNSIPIRKTSKGAILKNDALALIKTILEQRSVDAQQLYNFFCELILCHYYERYKAYDNIYQSKNFDTGVYFAVRNYSAFFSMLMMLGLLKNHNYKEGTMSEPTDTSKPQLDEEVEKYFDIMKYSNSQKALFFLGRMLNTIGYAQYKKSHEKKPILGKLNFNGMDKDKIIRLSVDLFEKGRQYSDVLPSIEYNHSLFSHYFDTNNWNMNLQEAVFFILSGYSFRKQSKSDHETEEEG